MTEYIANGTVLAWLIDPIRREVSIYRPGKPAEILVRPSKISGNPELKGFTLDLEEVFNEQSDSHTPAIPISFVCNNCYLTQSSSQISCALMKLKRALPVISAQRLPEKMIFLEQT